MMLITGQLAGLAERHLGSRRALIAGCLVAVGAFALRTGDRGPPAPGLRRLRHARRRHGAAGRPTNGAFGLTFAVSAAALALSVAAALLIPARRDAP